MKILFDNDAFAILFQCPEYAEDALLLQRISDTNGIEVIGSVTIIEELMGLSDLDTDRYSSALSEYISITKERILKPWNQLMFLEVQKKCSLSVEESLLEEELLKVFRNIVDNPDTAHEVYLQVTNQCENYEQDMNSALDAMLSDSLLTNEHPSDVRNVFKQWLQHFDNYAQDWFLSIFNEASSVSYSDLPHVKAFLNYVFTKQYEVICHKLRHKANDLYDRAHYVEASSVDVLFTNDNRFIRTCNRVPQKQFDVIKISGLRNIIT